MKRMIGVFITTIFMLSGCVAATEGYKLNAERPVITQNPIVTIVMEDDSLIKAELYPEKAFNTVANFVNLIQDGFYNGVTFHRIVPNFVIQGGDPSGDGTGGPGHGIFGEFEENGYTENDIKHVRGILSMARKSNDMNSAGSQFFIVVSDASNLDGSYAAFGKVIEGMDVVDAIVSGPASNQMALEPRVMKNVTVDTFDVEYEAEIIQ